MTMKGDSYKINKNISWKVLADKVVAVNVDNGDYYTLNATASIIWQELDKNPTLTDVEKIIANICDEVPENLQNDIEETLNYWIAEKLIEKIN